MGGIISPGGMISPEGSEDQHLAAAARPLPSTGGVQSFARASGDTTPCRMAGVTLQSAASADDQPLRGINPVILHGVVFPVARSSEGPLRGINCAILDLID